MATIPMGNFGQQVAGPGPMVEINRGDPIGRAGAQLANTVADVSADAQAAETRKQLQAVHEQKVKDEQAAAAAIRAKALTTLTSTRDKIADLHDEIANGVLDGSVPKDKAEATYNEKSAKLLDGLGSDLPEADRMTLQAQLNSDASRLGNSIRKTVTKRDRMDVTAGIHQVLEYQQREYRNSPEKATKQAMDTITLLGPHSDLTPDQLQALGQTWKEQTQFAAGYEAVSKARESMSGLKAAVKTINALPDLDPQKRAVLLDRVQGYQMHLEQKAEMAAQRAQREQERRMNKAKAEFDVFQAMADKGTTLDQTYVDRVLVATTGTPYQAGVRALFDQAKANGGFASQPIAEQQRRLDAVNAQINTNGRTPELDKHKEQLERILSGSKSDLEKDALRAGLDRGVITDLKPLDFKQGIPAMLQQIKDRVPQAERVGTWAGKDVSPVTEDEAAQIKTQLDALPPKDRSGMIAALSQTMGPKQAQAFARQIDKTDKPLALALALGSDQTSKGRLTSELLLKGQQFAKDKGAKGDEASGKIRAKVAEEVGDALSGKARTDTIEAAAMIVMGMQAEGESPDVKRAVRLALNGDLIEHNGKRLPVSAGVTMDVMRDRLAALKPDTFKAQAADGIVYGPGGKRVPLDDWLKDVPQAQLDPVGQGRYTVRFGTGVATNAKGRPIVIEVR